MMIKNKKWVFLLIAVIGAASFYVGGFIVINENLKAISGMCIGLGSALFCLGIGNFVIALTVSKVDRSNFEQRKNIEVNDERNIRIREKVGAKTNQVIFYMLCLIVLFMGFMQINIIAILMVSSVFIIELILTISLTNYYSKRM